MKNLLIAGIVLFFGLKVYGQKKEIVADSKISHVTVFVNNAEVTRKAKVNLTSGSNLVVFERLPQGIVVGSIQVEGSNDFTIVSVNSSVDYLKEGSDRPEVKVMKKELNRVNDEIKLNNAQLKVYDEQLQLLIANHVFKADNKGITVEDMLTMTELYRKKLWQIQEKKYDAEIKGKKMNEEYQRIYKQVGILENKFNRYTTKVILNLSASANVNAPVQISYIVQGAGWEANYDAKAKDLTSPLEITFKASVHQTTGEDWKDVKLKLSTGNPLKSKTKPELNKWQLYAYDEQDYKKKGKQKSMSKAYDMKTEAYGERESSEETIDAVVITNSEKITLSSNTAANYTVQIETGLTAEYDISLPYSIYSDGKNHTVEIKKENLKADYSYYAVPKLEKEAFLVANITDWGKYNFIPGYMNVFINDTYTGRSYFDTQSVEDTLTLSMGRDQSIVVQRKKQYEMCKTTVIGGNKKHNSVYDITVKNTRAATVKIVVYDQVPVSPYKEVEVSVEQISGAKYDKEKGELEWDLEIAPGDSKKINLNYSIKYPKDKFISNLEG